MGRVASWLSVNSVPSWLNLRRGAPASSAYRCRIGLPLHDDLTCSHQERPRMKLRLGTYALAGWAIVACRSAQSQSVLTHDARLPASFGMLSNVVELPIGRVVFTDTR